MSIEGTCSTTVNVLSITQVTLRTRPTFLAPFPHVASTMRSDPVSVVVIFFADESFIRGGCNTIIVWLQNHFLLVSSSYLSSCYLVLPLYLACDLFLTRQCSKTVLFAVLCPNPVRTGFEVRTKSPESGLRTFGLH